tara:strand:- start:566 stop:922 length:357 start_codon:yes stop_codon:yes gene_type:complete
MEETVFINLLDQADRDLDSFPFWASFKRACAEHSIKGITSLTPGRQALLILWEASSQGKDAEGKIINSSIEGKDMDKKIEKLKSDLIGHFMNEEMDEEALRRFFKSIKNELRRKSNLK